MQPTALDHLIALLLSSRSTKIYKSILWSRVRARNKKINYNSFRQHIYRLGRRGVIHSERNSIVICHKDLTRFIKTRNSVIRWVRPSGASKVLISFDIPETKKKTRDWLRNQLKYWDFKMIHQSLWLGAGPMPKEFVTHVSFLGIDKNVRIFNVKNLNTM